MPVSKKRKGAKRHRPSKITPMDVWRMKQKADTEERTLAAELAYGFLDGMRTDPDFYKYKRLIDTTNILSVAICMTTTPEDLEKSRCENLHEWLTEVGHDNVAAKIQQAHDLLHKVGQRAKRTGSYALDAETYQAMEEIIQMYEEIYDEAPRGFMDRIIKYCERAHTQHPDGRMTVKHLELNQYYTDIEKTWIFDEAVEPVA